MGYNNRGNYHEVCPRDQKHVHEVQGSVKFADREDPHGHRFCTVTEEAIPYGNNDHVHEVCFRTDTYDDHYHEFKGKTGCAIPVGGGRHVHFLESVTSVDDGHRHRFEVATLIENPTGNNHGDDHCDHHEQHEHYGYYDKNNNNYR